MTEIDPKPMGFFDHLEELRWVIIKCLVTLVITTAVCWLFTDPVFELLKRPLNNIEREVELILLSPLDAFLIKVKLALLAGVVLALPFLLWLIWSFVKPGLHRRERAAGVYVIVFGTLFFVAGVGFAYAILPISLRFLAAFTPPDMSSMWSLQKYLAFTFRLLLACGILFEMPVVISLLTRMGLISVATLKRIRPYAFVGMLIVSAVLTPPDIFTQLFLVGPLILLYELSIWLGACHEKHTARATNEEIESMSPPPRGRDGSGTRTSAHRTSPSQQEQLDTEKRPSSSSHPSHDDGGFSEIYRPKDSLDSIPPPVNEKRFFDDTEEDEPPSPRNSDDGDHS